MKGGNLQAEARDEPAPAVDARPVASVDARCLQPVGPGSWVGGRQWVRHMGGGQLAPRRCPSYAVWQRAVPPTGGRTVAPWGGSWSVARGAEGAGKAARSRWRRRMCARARQCHLFLVLMPGAARAAVAASLSVGAASAASKRWRRAARLHLLYQAFETKLSGAPAAGKAGGGRPGIGPGVHARAAAVGEGSGRRCAWPGPRPAPPWWPGATPNPKAKRTKARGGH